MRVITFHLVLFKSKFLLSLFRFANWKIVEKFWPFSSYQAKVTRYKVNLKNRQNWCSGHGDEHIGDLNSKHLNSKLISIANFYLFGIQMVAN